MPFQLRLLVVATLAACAGGDTPKDTDVTGDTDATSETDVTSETDATGETDVAVAATALAVPTTQATTGVEETVFTVTVQVVDASGALVTDATDEITLTGIEGAWSGPGSFGGTLTRAAVDGVATFDDLTWEHPEVVTFDLTAPGLTGVDDTTITFDAKPFTHLVVAQQDQDSTSGARGIVTVFDLAASGDIAPLSSFYGLYTEWEYSWGLGFDDVTGEILVGLYGGNAVARYPLDAAGEATASSMLVPASTELSGPSRITVDPFHSELYVPTEDDGKVYVFARDATGDATPLRVLGGDLSFAGDAADDVAIDYANDEIFVVGYNLPAVHVFHRTDDGDVAPVRSITGDATSLGGSAGVVYVPEHHELVVADYDRGSILVFDASATGDVAPLRTIAGDATLLASPSGIAWDPTTDELYVADENTQAILVFNRTDSGDVAPQRQISGDNVVFTTPCDVTLAR